MCRSRLLARIAGLVAVTAVGACSATVEPVEDGTDSVESTLATVPSTVALASSTTDEPQPDASLDVESAMAISTNLLSLNEAGVTADELVLLCEGGVHPMTLIFEFEVPTAISIAEAAAVAMPFTNVTGAAGVVLVPMGDGSQSPHGEARLFELFVIESENSNVTARIVVEERDGLFASTAAIFCQ